MWGGDLRGVCDPWTVASEPPMDGFTGVPERRHPMPVGPESGGLSEIHHLPPPGPEIRRNTKSAYNIGARKRAVCDLLLLATFAGGP